MDTTITLIVINSNREDNYLKRLKNIETNLFNQVTDNEGLYSIDYNKYNIIEVKMPLKKCNFDKITREETEIIEYIDILINSCRKNGINVRYSK
tara:strand:- start:877 stop:1158 length:282 start_codon:yes stop_codon:yes gene_type:complete